MVNWKIMSKQHKLCLFLLIGMLILAFQPALSYSKVQNIKVGGGSKERKSYEYICSIFFKDFKEVKLII